MAISFKSFFKNIKDVATNKKDLLNRKTFLGKLDIGSLRQLGRLTGGKESRKGQLRRYGNAASGAVGGAISGFKTGGPIGAIAGAIGGGTHGYQDKRAVTGRRALQKAGAGAGIGYGLGSGASALGSGGSGWTLGLNSAGAAGSTGAPGSTAGVNGVTSVAPEASKGNFLSKLLQSGAENMLSGGGDGSSNMAENPDDKYKIPQLYRSHYRSI